MTRAHRGLWEPMAPGTCRDGWQPGAQHLWESAVRSRACGTPAAMLSIITLKSQPRGLRPAHLLPYQSHFVLRQALDMEQSRYISNQGVSCLKGPNNTVPSSCFLQCIKRKAQRSTGENTPVTPLLNQLSPTLLLNLIPDIFIGSFLYVSCQCSLSDAITHFH